jgi:hypothetical protein
MLKMGAFAALALMVSCLLTSGCFFDVDVDRIKHEPSPLSPCATLGDGAMCTFNNDPTIVARCENNECKPFGCDVCPRLPCKTIACVDDLCRQSAMSDGQSCVAFSDPLATVGDVGTCNAGACENIVPCGTDEDCPTVECTATTCSEWGTCIGYSVLPGEVCDYAPNQAGRCFNYTCQLPTTLTTPRQASSD